MLTLSIIVFVVAVVAAAMTNVIRAHVTRELERYRQRDYMRGWREGYQAATRDALVTQMREQGSHDRQ